MFNGQFRITRIRLLKIRFNFSSVCSKIVVLIVDTSVLVLADTTLMLPKQDISFFFFSLSNTFLSLSSRQIRDLIYCSEKCARLTIFANDSFLFLSSSFEIFFTNLCTLFIGQNTDIMVLESRKLAIFLQFFFTSILCLMRISSSCSFFSDYQFS